MKKKKKYDFNHLVNKLQTNIITNNPLVWIPPAVTKFENIFSNSWFDIKHYRTKKNTNINPTNIINKIPKSQYKCIKVNLTLNVKQKFIINNWLNAYTIMYNETVKFIKDNYAINKIYLTNFIQVREKMLNIKKNIINNSCKINNTNKEHYLQFITNKSIIKTHIIDTAIKLACTNFKSCISKKEGKYIKHFNIRYLKFNRKNKTMTIETSFFKNGTICGNILGNIIATYDGKPFNLDDVPNKYGSDCLFKYDSKEDKYYLFVPEKINNVVNNNTKEFISLDPGVRTFLTGISEDEVVKIGDNMESILLNHYKRIDKLKKIENKWKREKKLKLANAKISNKVDDMHWKSIKWITTKYRNVLVGNLSTKSIISKSKSNYSGNYKKVIQSMKLYQYRTRLEYKCNLKNINYKTVNEMYSSKMCSVCGNIEKDLGSKKMYECEKCKIKMDRDVNGARNIYHNRNMKINTGK